MGAFPDWTADYRFARKEARKDGEPFWQALKCVFEMTPEELRKESLRLTRNP